MSRTHRIAMLALIAAVLPAAPVAAKAGDKLIRLRGIVVAPTETSGGITPTFPNEGVAVDNAVTPEVDFTYFATDAVAFELIAATSKHAASGKTGTTGSIGKLATTWALPPTLTAQYHLMPGGKVRPYVGAGLNYTLFYNEKASGGLETAVGSTKVKMSDSFGYALQAGVDIDLSDRMFLNADVKFIDMDTTATLRTSAIGTQRVRISIDPIVAGVGVGWRF